MTDDQLIESLRARTWPGDCEAAAFRLEELRARVAEFIGTTDDDGGMKFNRDGTDAGRYTVVLSGGEEE